jgi:hypothetical protein
MAARLCQMLLECMAQFFRVGGTGQTRQRLNQLFLCASQVIQLVGKDILE